MIIESRDFRVHHQRCCKRAGVSPTTVSIILNGKAEDRKISQATLEKVMNAVRDLDYQPNLSARRLRSNEIKKPSLAFLAQ